MPGDLRFIADAMLDRLARWMRLLGFDTLYFPHINDRCLLSLAVRDERLILTRDMRFATISNFRNFLMLDSNYTAGQLTEVIKALGIREFMPCRCACCNGILTKVHNKAFVRDIVPEHIFLSNDSFMECSACARVYWEGTHMKYFRKLIDDLLVKNGAA